jgi:hypothetical protein
VDTVRIEWAFTNALTGELVCANVGRPAVIERGKGAIWDYSQTIDPTGLEVAHCDGDRVHAIEPGETYFDSFNRHGLNAWLFIEHATPSGQKLAVDLPTVEVFNSMIMSDGSRSSSFGRIIAVLHANPAAPTVYDLGKALPAVQ